MVHLDTWRILHIDDDEDDHYIVRSMLDEAQGRTFSLEWASTLDDGRQKLHANHYQAVLVDYDLGSGSGIDLIREFVEGEYHAPLILLTGRGSYDVDMEAMHAGATLYLTKNEINPLLLERSIRYAIELKQTEHALRKSEAVLLERDQKLTVALDAAQLGAWTYTFDDHLLEMDARAQQMYRSEQPSASHDDIVDKYFHSKDAPAMQAALEKAADPAGDGRYHAQYRILNEDGTASWINAWGLAQFEGQGAERRAVRLIGASRDITWEKQSRLELERSNTSLRERETALRESEQRYAKLFDAKTNGIAHCRVITDEEGKPVDYEILRVNEAYEEITGIKRAEIEGRRAREVFPGIENFDFDYIANYGRVGLHGDELHIEVFFETLQQWLEIFVYSPKPGEFTAIFTDISPRKQAEEKLRASQAAMDAFFEKSPGILNLFNADLQYINTDPNTPTYFSLDRQEILGKSVWDLNPRFAEEFLGPMAERVIRSGIPELDLEVPGPIPGKQNETGYWRVSYFPVSLAEGNVGLGVMGVDITEQKRVEQALRQSEQFANKVLSGSQNGLYIYDTVLEKNIFINPQYTRLTGYTLQDLQSMSSGEFLEKFHPDDLARVREHFQSVHKASDGEMRQIEYRFRRKDGEWMWANSYESVFTRTSAGDVKEYIGTFIDITQRKEAVARQQELQEENRRQRDLLERLVQAVPAGIAFLKGSQHVFTLVNSEYEFYARDKGPLIGRTVSEVWPELVSNVIPQMDRVYQTGEPFSIQNAPLTIVRGEVSEENYYSYSFMPIRQADGSIEGVMILALDTTQTMRHRQALEAQSAQLQAVLNSLPVGVWIADREGKLLSKNEQADRIWAGDAPLLERVEQYGQYTAWPAGSEEQLSVDEYPMARTLHTGQPAGPDELRIRRFDGSQGFVLASATPVYDHAEQFAGAVAINVDITEWKQAEATLQRLESRWNAALENIAEGVIIATEDEQVIYWNPAAQAMHGFTTPDEGIEPLEKTPITFQLWTPDGSHLLELDEWPMRRIKRGETVRNLELRIRRPDQGWEKIFSYSGVMVDTAGGERLIFLTCHDLTEQRRAEEALRESEMRLRQLADAMPQLVWSAQPDGVMDYCNQRFRLYQGIVQVEQNRWEWESVLHPDDVQPTAHAWLRALQTGDVYQTEQRMRMADGSYRWHLTRSVPARDDQGQTIRWYGTSTDIHDYKMIQEETAAYAEKLKRSNEELENFAFIASHDLQEPLRKVVLFGSSLRRQLEGRLPDDAEENLDRIQNAARRMQGMIDALLDLSRVNTRGSEFERVHLTAIAQDVVADLDAALQTTGGQVIVDDLPVVQGDPLQLRQLLHNLVANALKYHRQGVPPLVQVRGEIVREGDARFVRLTIADNGIGFEEAQAEKIFQPFMRLHGRQYEGSGIGLAICRKIVERHGGAITASSRPGAGSQFIITLPAPVE
jgi:PAS domain S-box-containing protein